MRFQLLFLLIFLLPGCFWFKKKPVASAPAPSGPTILSLFSDSKAAPRVGDLVTVQIVENASASKKNTSLADKKTDLTADMKLDTTDNSDSTKLGLKTKNKYDAASRYLKQGSIVANVTAVVEQVFPNGNVFIRGQQEITLDKGVQIITLSGIVRPEDISGTNVVSSTRLASAKITYRSKREPNIHHQSIIGWIFGWIF